jgi:Fe-S-cluster-containing dehydrogenase component
MNRRDFLKLSAAGGALVAADVGIGHASTPAALPPDAVGILYDSTLCIGCKACMAKCKEYNVRPGGALEGYQSPPTESQGQLPFLDAPDDLSGKTVNIIQARIGEDKRASFVKRHCMHCLEPACVSACPVSAMRKDARTGIVTYNKDACIGCRYCQVACPFNIPRFEWELAFPQIRKCQLCSHRQAEGGYSACCEFCPTGASIYGKVTDLRAEVERRLAAAPGSLYAYPQQRVDAKRTMTRPVPRYTPSAYGLREVGGTQYLMLAGVPFERLGLPALPEASFAGKSESIQHTLYKGMIAPGILLAGLLFVAYKNTRDHE